MRTKEIAVSLPLLALLIECMFLEGRLKKRLLFLFPIFLLALMVPLSYIDADRSLTGIVKDISDASRVDTEMPKAQYLMTQARVAATYLRLLVLPFGQNLDYDYPSSLFDLNAALSLAAMAGLVCLCIYLLHRSRNGKPALRLASFGIFWFFLCLIPESVLVSLVDVIFEHRVYFPSVGAVLFLSVGALALLDKIENRGLKAAASGLLLLIPFLFSSITYARNDAWRTPVSLWTDVVKKSPYKARGHTNLGDAYSDAGLVDEAIKQYLTAVKLGPDIKKITSYEEARAVDPNFAKPYNNLGLAYLSKGMYDEAIENFKASLRVMPGYKDARINLEVAYAEKRKSPDAALSKCIKKRVRDSPRHIKKKFIEVLRRSSF